MSVSLLITGGDQFRKARSGNELESLDPEEIVKTATFFAKDHKSSERLFYRLAVRACDRDIINSLTVPQLVDVLWSFAKKRIDQPPELFAAITKQMLKKVDQFRPLDIAKTLWALTRLGMDHPKELYYALTSEALRKFKDFKKEGYVASTAWGLSCFYPKLSRVFLLKAAVEGTNFTRRREQQQINHSSILSGLEPPFELPIKPRNYHMDPFQEEVYGFLSRVLPHRQIGFNEQIENIETDITIHGSLMLILECDEWRTHRTAGWEPVGEDIIQDRIFYKHGLPVHILDSDWYPARSDQARSEVIRNSIKQAIYYGLN